MSDLDDLEQLAGLPPEWKSRRRLRYRASGETETHCKRGHALTPDNVYVSVGSGKSPRRNCKMCDRLRRICKEDA